MDTSPGSLGDPNRCWHEDLLEADYKHAGIGYHDSMKYLCNSCGVGIHVTFEKLSRTLLARYPVRRRSAEPPGRCSVVRTEAVSPCHQRRAEGQVDQP